MASFGSESGPSQECRYALQGATNMSRAIEILNQTLVADNKYPLCVGIGIHVGQAIGCEMGYRSALMLGRLAMP